MWGMTTLGLYARTLRHLKLVQITNRIVRKILRARVVDAAAPKVRTSGDHSFLSIRRPRSIFNENEFQFLNKREVLSFPDGWNNEKLPKLWLYNLHYFEGLLNQETPNTIKEYLIELWIEQNPQGVGNGWEPYPNSLRIANWIKWVFLGNQLTPLAEKSLATQIRYLTKTLEYHLQGNHLFANAKALIFAGVFFEGNEADKWLKIGLNILQKQIPEQFLNDGAHFELSTTYHALLTEDLLDIIQLMKLANVKIPLNWIETAIKAVRWLVVMTRPDGLPPLFNDAAYEITPSLEDILILQNSAGIDVSSIPPFGMTDLPESGYFRYETSNYSCFGDAGQIGPDYIPGHAHCDMLNFELFAGGKPIIVDTGTSTYEICERRQTERSTASHNTVQIGHDEQSEIWGAFRVARRAKFILREVLSDTVEAEYIGYKSTKACHKRIFNFEEKLIIINDETNQSLDSIARLHFHPEVSVILKNNIVEAGPLKIEISGEDSVKIVEYDYAPEFNMRMPAKVLEVCFSKQLTTKISL